MVSSHAVALSVVVSPRARLVPDSRFPSFSYAPALRRDLLTQTNMFCIIRTSFNQSLTNQVSEQREPNISPSINSGLTKRMITTMFFILVPFFKRAPYIIIHLARHAERREEACWCQSYFPTWIIHPFICPVPVPVPVLHFGFSTRPIAWYCLHVGKTLLEVIIDKR